MAYFNKPIQLLKFLFFCVFLLVSFLGSSQENFPVNGTKNTKTVYQGFTNATIYVDYQTVIESGSLLILNGEIIDVGSTIVFPKNTVIHDLEGRYIYPSFIDLYTSYGIATLKKAPWKPQPQLDTKKAGAFSWNQAIKPEIKAADLWHPNSEKATELRKLGFGTVLTWQNDGIAQGTSTLVALNDNAHQSVLLPEAAAHYSFRKGVSKQKYPTSQMGAIALLKQTYLDALWYETSKESLEKNLSLEAWNENQKLPQFFDVTNKLEISRADKIGDHNGVQYIFKGNGDEYQRIEEIKETKGKLIIPLNFPNAYDVSDPHLERLVSFKEMKHWEMAPTNPMVLSENNIEFSITSYSKGTTDFLANLRKAIQYGLTEAEALKALTYNPAHYINYQNEIGSLEKGKAANFFIASGNIFHPKQKIIESWVLGDQYIVEKENTIDIKGVYELSINNKSYDLTIINSKKGEIVTINSSDTTKIKVAIDQIDELISFTFNPKDDFSNGIVRLTGNIFKDSKIWQGKGQLKDGTWFDWLANRTSKEDKKKDSYSTPTVPNTGKLLFPLMAYGWTEFPTAETVMIKNATIWTCESEGVLEKSNILIHQGKIAAVGKDIDLELVFGKKADIVPVEIDGYGKHITPGIIDEHSHIAISNGVNEAGQTSTAEVSIATVINSDDINIYRQLAGGVTSTQLLHGSANPIGGQSGMIKLRWGKSPEEMLFENAAPFIKFALGENVKQSNWGIFNRIRFPQTRMGVEQVYYDHFIQAKHYDDTWKNYRYSLSQLSNRQIKNKQIPSAPRRDLELETLAQILNSERFITCHSYQQGEINMLMHVADSMGFTLNTFTHILEGYKVADKMKEHGAGASTFADWWAYKYEVKDAIPYNAAILNEHGITTALNSDDPEMGRRLNQEAAKIVKYGNVSEEDALNMVTINPAKLLHIDDKVGSLKVGKDADIVVWSAHPLSVYAVAEKTYVDGICYFSLEKDLEKRAYLKKERARLIQLMLEVKANGGKMQLPTKKEKHHDHCDTIEHED